MKLETADDAESPEIIQTSVEFVDAKYIVFVPIHHRVLEHLIKNYR